jgi:hypothetical protein
MLRLAWALVRTLVAPLFGLRRGLAQFRASYAKDRLPALSGPERRQIAKLGGCIACGLCNAGEGSRIVASKGSFAGVMDLMLASSRSMPDYDVAARSFAAVPDERLAELESICPARVPMRELKRFVLAKAEDVGQDA